MCEDAARRLRILRAAGYRCGVRSAIGTLCGAPARHVDPAFRHPVCDGCAAGDA